MLKMTTGILVLFSAAMGNGAPEIAVQPSTRSVIEVEVPKSIATTVQPTSKEVVKNIAAIIANKQLEQAQILSEGFRPSLLEADKAPVEEILTEEERLEQLKSSPVVESYVRDYFQDVPILVHVAKCESRFRHFNKEHTVIRGEQNSQDVGVMQINEKYHLDRSVKLGYNIYSIEGNMAYARRLYEKEGTAPWASSSPCWGKYKSNTQLAISNK